MNQEMWSAVDRYITDLLVDADEVLEHVIAASDAAGLPSIQVSPPQGKLLGMYVSMIGARKVLEIGTLGGYSTIWMARALPEDGQLVSIEIDPLHAEVAQANFDRAGLSQRIELHTGNAREVMPRLIEDGYGPFDLVFIDADKASIPEYFAWSVQMSRPGSAIIVDNVIREGAVVNESSEDASVKGVRRLNEIMANDPRIDATVLQTVGVKGYDGFSVALVRE